MKSAKRGKDILEAEVSNISAHGFWLFVVDREYFLSFDEYPWFRNARVNHILHVQLLHGRHLHWPDLDVDLELESLADPGKYPLIYR